MFHLEITRFIPKYNSVTKLKWGRFGSTPGHFITSQKFRVEAILMINVSSDNASGYQGTKKGTSIHISHAGLTLLSWESYKVTGRDKSGALD